MFVIIAFVFPLICSVTQTPSLAKLSCLPQAILESCSLHSRAHQPSSLGLLRNEKNAFEFRWQVRRKEFQLTSCLGMLRNVLAWIPVFNHTVRLLSILSSLAIGNLLSLLPLCLLPSSLFRSLRLVESVLFEFFHCCVNTARLGNESIADFHFASYRILLKNVVGAATWVSVISLRC